MDAEKAAKAHTNLNMFACVAAMLESGCIYPVSHSANATAQKIIKLCQAEQQRQLRIYDRERED